MTTWVEYKAIPFTVSNDFFVKPEHENCLGNIICIECPGGLPNSRRRKATWHCPDMPQWAWPFHPSIPLVDRNYRPGKGLLIYASAENLSWLNQHPTPDRFVTDEVWSRYRVQYEQEGHTPKSLFPDVGIQPVTDGDLFAAGLFVAEQTGLPVRRTPRAFLETMTVTSWCKFSIRSVNNQDYIDDTKKKGATSDPT